MKVALVKNWWSLVIRGLVAILLGVITLAIPGITIGALVLLFGVYALIDGVMSFAGVWRASKEHERWGALLLEGFAGIVAGIVAFAWPAITLLVLVYVVAAWAVVTGVVEIAAAVRLRRHIGGEWLLALAGVTSLIFGILVLAAPIAGALVIAIWIGVYALIFGAMLIGLGFRLRTLAKPINGSSPAVRFS
jgi:uncharacterized membrane protein HdeD (DUF308 family)